MDPLSLAANIVAILGAASAVAHGVEKLSQLRDAPQQIMQLLNEISDFRTVLTIVQETTRQLGEQSLDADIVNHIQSLIERSHEIMHKIKGLLQSGLIQDFENVPADGIKVSWRRWLRNDRNFQNLSISLRNIRLDLASSLAVLNVSEIPRVRITLQGLSVTQQDLSLDIRDRGTNTSSQLENLAMDLASVRTNLDENVRPALNSIQSLLQVAHAERKLPTHPTHHGPAFRIRTSIHEPCNPMLCMCQCHKGTIITTPRWMTGMIGALFIGYSGIPQLDQRRGACSERSCRQRNFALLKVSYWFPSWFLQRVIVFRDKWTPRDGHMISVRTPRFVGHPGIAFVLANKGDIKGLQDLFAQGKASPFDTHIMGGNTLLHAAVGYLQFDTCKFLLQQYADPKQEDNKLCSPVEYLWTRLLENPSEEKFEAFKNVFGSVVDAEEDLEQRQFSTIHLIVLGLTYMDLEKQLLISTQYINAQDSLGRTPLYWSTSRCDLESMKTLLAFGADLYICNNRNMSCFYAATTKSTQGAIEPLAILLQAASTNAIRGRHNDILRPPTERIIREILDKPGIGGRTTLINTAIEDYAAQARLLLAHGAAVEYSDPSVDNQPLCWAVQFNSHSIIRVLIEHGARHDVVDAERMGILHLAATCGDLETIRILREMRICCINTESLDMYDDTPLQSFDIQRAAWQKEDKATLEESREAFLQLLASIRAPSQDHICWANPSPPMEAVKPAPQTKISDSEEIFSIYSTDDEDFFDAKSVGESDFKTSEEKSS